MQARRHDDAPVAHPGDRRHPRSRSRAAATPGRSARARRAPRRGRHRATRDQGAGPLSGPWARSRRAGDARSVVKATFRASGVLKWLSDDVDAPAVRSGGGDLAAQHLGDLRHRHRALAQHARLVAGQVDDRRGHARPGTARRRGRPRPSSPSCSVASATVVAGGRPEMFALDTAIGPISRSSSSATGCSGIRSITVPRVSPRSQFSEGACGSTSDSPPGQNASTSSRAAARHGDHQAVDGVPGPDQHRDGHVRPAALGREQRRAPPRR